MSWGVFVASRSRCLLATDSFPRRGGGGHRHEGTSLCVSSRADTGGSQEAVGVACVSFRAWAASEVKWVRSHAHLSAWQRWRHLKLVVVWTAVATKAPAPLPRGVRTPVNDGRAQGEAHGKITTDRARWAGRDGRRGPQGWMEVTDASMAPEVTLLRSPHRLLMAWQGE